MKTRSRLMATALVAASLGGLSVAAPASAAENNIDLGRFSIQDRGRSVDWTFNYRCERGYVYRVSIDLTQRYNKRWDAEGDARSDRLWCNGKWQRLSLNIRADEGRFTNGRARAEVDITSVRGRDWDRKDDGDNYKNGDSKDEGDNYKNGDSKDDGDSYKNGDRNRGIHVTQWVQLRGGWDNNRTPYGY